MKVYIACPAYAVSGGAELLHQLSGALSKRKIENYMVYFGIEAGKNPTPERYQKYQVKCADSYVDADDSVYVLPEVGVHEVKKCVQGKAAIWWLSVNNYVMCYRQQYKTTFDIFNLASRENAYQFVQSQYAKEFLMKFFHISESTFLSDYINEDILQYGKVHINDPKENICVYNPAKGLENIEPLIEKSGDKIKWVALKGFSPLQMAEVLSKAKVYIDFGGHPGKDRIPREAAACGCCILTNREGSAANSVDVRIPECYKFANVQDTEDILRTIEDIMNSYDGKINDFKEYREYIAREHDIFEEEVDCFVNMMTR